MLPNVDTHALNARLLRFRSHPEQEDACTLAEDLIAAQRYGDARGVSVSAQSDDGEQVGRLLVLEGRAWYMDRDLVRAQAVLVKAAKLNPNSASAFRWLGAVLLERGDSTRAARALERAAQLVPGDPEVLVLLDRALGPALRAPAPARTQPVAQPAVQPAEAAAPIRAPVVTRAAPVAPRPIKSAVAHEPAVSGTAPSPPRVAQPMPRTPLPAAPLPAAPSPTLARAAVPVPPRPVIGMQRPGFPAAPPAPPRSPYPERALDEPTESFRRSTPLPAATADGDGFVDLSDGELEDAVASSPGMTSPGIATSPGRVSSPGVATSPGRVSSAGAVTSPGHVSSPGVAAAPRIATSPGVASSPGRTSSPGVATSPGHVSSPGVATSPGRISSPGVATSPGRISSPGVASSPGTTSAGAKTSPGSWSSPGRISSPGSASSPGTQSSAGRFVAPRTGSSPGDLSAPSHRAAPLSDEPLALDVEFEPAAARAFAAAETQVPTMAGLGMSPLHQRVDHTPPPGWDASVVAHWPVHDSLDSDESAPHRPLATPEVAAEPAPDLVLGTDGAQPDDPEAVLALLRAQGLLEPEGAISPEWTAERQVERGGTRLRNALVKVWLVTLALAAGGYLGWQQWVAHRHAEAAQLLAEAKAAAYESDFKRLVDAERLLRLARDKYPRSSAIPRIELFVQAQRVLDNGSRDLNGLSSAVVHAEQLHDTAYVAVGRAVLAVYSGSANEVVTSLVTEASKVAAGEPELLYITGRIAQRMGEPEATVRLQAAATAAPDLIAPAIALAEEQEQSGHDAEAVAAFDAILKRRPEHLRAALWRAFLLVDRDDPAQSLAALEAMSKGARASAPIDRILWSLARARLRQRQGQRPEAVEAVRDALSAGASEPRWLALIAVEARRAGQLGLAQQAAGQAVAAAPRAAAYRSLLASILIERQDGEHALSILSDESANDPSLLLMRAQAALLAGEPDALRSGLAATETFLASNANDVTATGLRLRLRAALEPNPKLLAEAKALLKRAPGDLVALRALADIGLALHAPDEAKLALGQLVAAAPEDAEAHQLLGRAKRMAGDATGAEASLRRALALSPNYPAALSALGSLLLDEGKYEDADAIYQTLCTQSPMSGRLGRAEALIALGKLDDAQVQLAGVAQPQQISAAVRETTARLALARKKPGEAIALLRPLVEANAQDTGKLVLYGDALYAAEQVNPAAAQYEAALAIDSELPEALLGRAEVHLRAERTGEALELLEKAKTSLATRLRAPEVHSRMQMLFGHAYVQRAKKGDLELARDSLRQAIAGKPTAEAYFWLGEAVGGRITPEAASALKHYLELEPDGYYAARAKRSLGPLL